MPSSEDDEWQACVPGPPCEAHEVREAREAGIRKANRLSKDYNEAWQRFKKIDENIKILANEASSNEDKRRARNEIKRDETWLHNTRPFWREIEHDKHLRWRHEVVKAIYQIWGWGDLPPIIEMANDPRLVAVIDALPETPSGWIRERYLKIGPSVPRRLLGAIKKAIAEMPLELPPPAKPGRKTGH